jgi:hypothetical protein
LFDANSVDSGNGKHNPRRAEILEWVAPQQRGGYTVPRANIMEASIHMVRTFMSHYSYRNGVDFRVRKDKWRWKHVSAEEDAVAGRDADTAGKALQVAAEFQQETAKAQQTGCLRGRVSWPGTRTGFGGWSASRVRGKERLRWISSPFVDNSDPCKKNRELHRVELPRSIKGMTHSNRVNQLAETFLLDFDKWLAVMESLLFTGFGDIVREMVANSFDLWQKDSFSAAEEIQESADAMESTYRTWVRERRQTLSPEDLD